MRKSLLSSFYVTLFLIISPGIAASQEIDIVGPSFAVTDDGTVDNMEAVYNGRNIALFYSWAPGTTDDPYFFKNPGTLYFQLFDRNLKPTGIPRKLIERGIHQVKAIWDGEKYFVAATAWHKTNSFFHHKSLLFFILDEKGNILKQKEIEQGRNEQNKAYVPSLLLLTGNGIKHQLVYRNDVMNIGNVYSNVFRYSQGNDIYIINIDSKESDIKTRIKLLSINDNGERSYHVTLSEKGFAAFSSRGPWYVIQDHKAKFSILDFEGAERLSIPVGINDSIYRTEAFKYLNGNYYLQLRSRSGKEAYIMTPDLTGTISLKKTDVGIIDDAFTSFVSGNTIVSCYFSRSNHATKNIVLRRHGIKGEFIDRITPVLYDYITPYYSDDNYFVPEGLEWFYYRTPTIVSVGTRSYLIYVEARDRIQGAGYVHWKNYEYRAREISNYPFTKSRVVYIRVGTEDVLPKIRLVMWDVANVPNVRITMPDGTKRIYAPTGHMQVKHFGKTKKLILRATGTDGEEIERTIWVKP